VVIVKAASSAEAEVAKVPLALIGVRFTLAEVCPTVIVRVVVEGITVALAELSLMTIGKVPRMLRRMRVHKAAVPTIRVFLACRMYGALI
jgi:hypothetical protein